MWEFWKIWELIQIAKVTTFFLSFSVALLLQLKVLLCPYAHLPPYTLEFILLYLNFLALYVKKKKLQHILNNLKIHFSHSERR